jgi:hypothetical protein
MPHIKASMPVIAFATLHLFDASSHIGTPMQASGCAIYFRLVGNPQFAMCDADNKSVDVDDPSLDVAPFWCDIAIPMCGLAVPDVRDRSETCRHRSSC